MSTSLHHKRGGSRWVVKQGTALSLSEGAFDADQQSKMSDTENRTPPAEPAPAARKRKHETPTISIGHANHGALQREQLFF